MTTIGERIKYVRKIRNLTQQKFADEIGVQRNTIATYEIGRSFPMDAVITSICRTYNVSEDWLRTGDGEPFVQLSREAEISRWVGEVLRDESPTDRARLLHALIGATPEEIHAICQFARRLAAEFDDE